MKKENKTPPKPKGKKKNAAPEPAPEPAPAIGKNGRPIRPKMNPEARKAVTSSSSWTGKLPATLLHEHCQRSKWEKVNFDMVGREPDTRLLVSNFA